MDFDYTTETITPDTTAVLTIGGTGSFLLPTGSTAQRPTSSAGQLRYNSDTLTLEYFSNSTWFPLSPSNPVHQVSHGFTVIGTPIYHNGTNWVKAKSNASTTLATAIVVQIPGSDDFSWQQYGYADGLSGLTAGQYYFTDAVTAGTYTSTEPTSPNFSNPIFRSISTTAVEILNYRPAEIGSTSFTFDSVVTMLDMLVLPKASGYGIKVDPSAPTFGWADLLGPPVVKTTGAAAPTFGTYRGNILEYYFSNAVTQEIFFNFHIPHDYVPGTDMYIHVHWSQTTVDTGGAAGAPGAVKWQFDVSYAKGYNQDGFIAPITTSVTQTASSTQYYHQIAEVQLSAASPSASQLDSDNIQVDGVILVRLFRDPSDAADTLNQTPFVHFCDIHYQTTGVHGTKQKNGPDFYT